MIKIVAAIVTLMLALSPSRIVHFAHGTATIETIGNYEHIIVKDAKGGLLSISDCDAGSGKYDDVVRFAKALKAAFRRNDRDDAAAMMQYPLRVNVASAKGYFVQSKPALLARFDRVFGLRDLHQIATLEPYNVFCRNGMSTIGNGVFWMLVVRRGQLRAAVFNRADPGHAQPNTSADMRLKGFVRSYLQSLAPADETTRVAVAAIPDNDLLVYVEGRSWCGTGGCNLLVLKRVGRMFFGFRPRDWRHFADTTASYSGEWRARDWCYGLRRRYSTLL